MLGGQVLRKRVVAKSRPKQRAAVGESAAVQRAIIESTRDTECEFSVELRAKRAHVRFTTALALTIVLGHVTRARLDRRDYSVRLSDRQLAAIIAAFPSSVCDFTRKGVFVRAPDTWLSYGSSN